MEQAKLMCLDIETLKALFKDKKIFTFFLRKKDSFYQVLRHRNVQLNFYWMFSRISNGHQDI